MEILEKVVGTLNPEVEPGDLAAQMVKALALPGRLQGARLWRIENWNAMCVAPERHASAG